MMASLMDEVFLGEPLCGTFVDYLGFLLIQDRDLTKDRDLQHEIRLMQRRFLNGHSGPVATKPSKRKRHKWR